MKNALLLFLLFLGLPLHAQNEAAQASNQFAFDCFNILQKESGNISFSPYSSWIALAMNSAGAGGGTLQEMGETLHIAKPEGNSIHDQSGIWTKNLISLKSVELKTANRLWVDNLFIPEKNFKQLMEKDYAGGFVKVNFAKNTEAVRKQINAWVEQQTAGYIKNLIHPDDLTSNNRLVLTNAVYFKGTWEKPFNPADTRPAPFISSDGTRTEIPMMHFREYLSYFENGKYRAVKLDYKGKETSMILVLPEGNASLQFDAKGFQKFCSRFKDEEVVVSLPRFETEQRIEMIPVLKKLGMKSAFTDDANFSRMTSDFDPTNKGSKLRIGKVIHQAFVKVSEDGTKAAAATLTAMDIGTAVDGPPPKMPKIFNADHPFLFFIVHNPTGGILFMGRVDNPKN